MSDLLLQESESDEEGSTELDVSHKVYVSGYVHKRYHNASLSSICHDLQTHFFVSSDIGDGEWQSGGSRRRIASADVMLFFVNEYTLKDTNSLLALQYAWYLMLPILMMRPPHTKLVISKREQMDDEKILILANGSIVRSPTTPWHIWDTKVVDTIDYALLQDILYEGYKVSIVYDRNSHSKCMERIIHRLHKIFSQDGEPGAGLSSSNSAASCTQPLFYLSSTNGSRSHSSRRDKKTKRSSQIRTSKSATCFRNPGHIKFDNVGTSPNLLSDRFEEDSHRYKLKSPPPPERPISSTEAEDEEEEEVFIEETKVENEETPIEDIKPPTPRSPKATAPVVAQNSIDIGSRKSRTISHASSTERRISLSCLDDISNYQRTQYLIFPMRDSSKKPYVIKFPEDLEEEDAKNRTSVYGSDTSLEEEIKLADQISSGINIDDQDGESPIMSPAPFMDAI